MNSILFVDNDPDFLSTRAEFLERAGYQVSKATSLADAERILRDGWAPLVILDVRMENDDDEKDISGFIFAKQEFHRAIHKIVLTNFPSYIHQALDGIFQIVDFLGKQDGPQALISAIESAFTRRVRINWNLAIDWKARDAFSLVKQIEPNLEGERLLSRAEEFEDLFRRLFYEKDHVRVERLLWQRDARLALIVFAFKGEMKPESCVVVCGQNAVINEEAHRFDEFSPKAPGKFGTLLDDRMRAETTHFAANAYTLSDNDLEGIQTLVELFRFGAEKTLTTALNVLYNETLPAWYQGEPWREKTKTLDQIYREQLHLDDELAAEFLVSRFQAIEERIFGVEIMRKEGTLNVHFPGPSFTYTDPLPVLASSVSDLDKPAWMVIAPGELHGETVVTDDKGHTWLTDFAKAGSVPAFWNFTSLEAAIRYDWVEAKKLQHRHDLERALIFSEFARFEIHDLEEGARKAGRVLLALRKLAARTVGKDTFAYHRGIFFHAAHRLMDFDPATPLTENERTRLSHLLLSMAMLAHLTQNSVDAKATDDLSLTELGMDEESLAVLIGGRKIRLQPQPFSVFKYLFQNAGRICSTEELVREALAGNSQYLHTLIGRIRREIEQDPKQPRYLLTEHNVGYRLVKKPQ